MSVRSEGWEARCQTAARVSGGQGLPWATSLGRLCLCLSQHWPWPSITANPSQRAPTQHILTSNAAGLQHPVLKRADVCKQPSSAAPFPNRDLTSSNPHPSGYNCRYRKEQKPDENADFCQQSAFAAFTLGSGFGIAYLYKQEPAIFRKLLPSKK